MSYQATVLARPVDGCGSAWCTATCVKSILWPKLTVYRSAFPQNAHIAILVSHTTMLQEAPENSDSSRLKSGDTVLAKVRPSVRLSVTRWYCI